MLPFKFKVFLYLREEKVVLHLVNRNVTQTLKPHNDCQFSIKLSQMFHLFTSYPVTSSKFSQTTLLYLLQIDSMN